jgi:hypothetical protein
LSLSHPFQLSQQISSVSSHLSIQEALSQLEKTSTYQQESKKAAEGEKAPSTPGMLKFILVYLT